MSDQYTLFDQPQEQLEQVHVRNQKLFSSYYLTFKLPELDLWQRVQSQAKKAFEQIKTIYKEAETLNLFKMKNEAQTEESFIRPVFEVLGFEHFDLQPALKGYGTTRTPDYALFLDKDSHQAARRVQNEQTSYWTKATVVGEAKYWNRPMNDRVKEDQKDPSDATKQIVGYLRDVGELTNGKTNWGILTNGKLWRLFRRQAGYTAETYVELDLEAVIQADDLQAFTYFYGLFSCTAFRTDAELGESWLQFYLKESESYATDITKHLRELIFDGVFDGLAQGFVHYRRNRLGIQKETDESKRMVFQGCLTLLYRLLFLLNAESRQLLPLDDDGYYERSLRKLVRQLREDRGKPKDRDHDLEYWHHLDRLFGLMNDGAPDFNLPRYNGGLFKRPDENCNPETLSQEELGPWFLETHALADPYLLDALDQLTSDQERESSEKQAIIDYSSLGVRHLGEIYEGLLEFKVEIAEDERVVAVGSKKKPEWKKESELTEAEKAKLDAGQLRVVEVGQPYIVNDKGERKATGSYYTPHYIVEYIVEHTVGPQLDRFQQEKDWCDAIEQEQKDLDELYEQIIEGESEKGKEQLDTLWNTCKSDEEQKTFLCNHMDTQWGKHRFDPATRALELKVLDPAMGSGHFLVHAVDVVSERVVDFLNKYPESPVGSQLEHLRKGILENVKNQGVLIDQDKLNDVNLIKRMVMKRCIYGVDLNPMAVELAKLSLWLDSFTVGAPLSFLNHHLKWGNSLIGAIDVSKHLPSGSQRQKEFQLAVQDLLRVAEISDATISEVEQSQQLYSSAKERLEPTKRRVSVDLAQYFFDIKDITLNQVMDYAYADQDNLIPKDKHQRLWIENYRRAQELAREQSFFHWELEFPEVWYTKTGPRANSGFDAVLGNPPYVRQEQIKGSKGYFKATFQVYNSIADLYTYFYENSQRLLCQGGRFGMITSNKFMRAAYGKPLRKFLAESVNLRQIIDFGDLPVFPEAAAYPSILVTSNEPRNSQKTQYLKIESLQFGVLNQFVKDNAANLPADAFQGEDWHLMNAKEFKVLRKVEQVSVPLKTWLGDVEIRRGILTGLNEAFFIDEATREELIKKDSKSAEIIKPLVVGDDIKRYEIDFRGRYLIWTYIGVPIKEYPAIFEHLKQYQSTLESRWDKGNHWWELRHCDYYEDFEKPKIMYPVIAKDNIFAMDDQNYYSNDKTFIISEANNYCLAVLNSGMGFMWAKNELSWLRGGFLEYRAQSIQELPIRRIFFTTPKEERKQQVNELKALYHEILEPNGEE